jgi:hypothetical protein
MPDEMSEYMSDSNYIIACQTATYFSGMPDKTSACLSDGMPEQMSGRMPGKPEQYPLDGMPGHISDLFQTSQDKCWIEMIECPTTCQIKCQHICQIRCSAR